jgi:hypothetical protein
MSPSSRSTLHAAFEDDRGGNQVGISGGICSWDLHARLRGLLN